VRLTGVLTRDVIVTTATRGRGDMPAFGPSMSQDQLQDVAAYIVQMVRDRKPAN
jgi:mono/diheme cytochrome c family protein